MDGKKPVQVFKAGGVRAAIWENTIERDGRSVPAYSVQIDRTYKDGEEWKRTNRFRLSELPRVELVARKAFEFLSLKGENDGDKE